MRILFQNIDGQVGGATDQIEALVSGLKRYNHDTDYSNAVDVNLSKYDLVVFNHLNSSWTKKQYLNAVKQNVPFIVKCIWHEIVPGWENEFRFLDHEMVSLILKQSSGIIVESSLEKERVIVWADNPLLEKKMTVFLPCVHPAIQNSGTPLQNRPFIHANGRYQPFKNLLMVIEAAQSLNLPVITAGTPHYNPEYFDQCKAVNYGTVLDNISKEELNKIYNQTRVYVCASPRETVSASICEAIACGCRVVSSSGNLRNNDFNQPGYYVFQYGNWQDLKGKILLAYNDVVEQQNEFWTQDRLCSEFDLFLRQIEFRKPVRRSYL